MSEIRYHFDEHIDNAIVVGLRRRGIDVSTTVDEGLLEASDAEQLAFAIKSKRVFVTCDRGIQKSLETGASHSGIVITRPGRKMIGPSVNYLAALHRNKTAEELAGQLIYFGLKR